MATFIVLATFTDKGIGKVKDTIGRAEKNRRRRACSRMQRVQRSVRPKPPAKKTR